jgi:arginine/lysine/ornithine decarboxylase
LNEFLQQNRSRGHTNWKTQLDLEAIVVPRLQQQQQQQCLLLSITEFHTPHHTLDQKLLHLKREKKKKKKKKKKVPSTQHRDLSHNTDLEIRINCSSKQKKAVTRFNYSINFYPTHNRKKLNYVESNEMEAKSNLLFENFLVENIQQ